MNPNRYTLTGVHYREWLKYSVDECSEFIHIWANIKTWLNVDICLDDDAYYKMNEHPLWIYFRNGYDEGAEWIPLIVTKNICYIPLLNCALNITFSDYDKVCDFCKMFYGFIKQLADSIISYSDFTSAVYNHMSILTESNNTV